MQFKRLYMRNVLAVGGEAVEILFNNYSGIVLIEGKNLDVLRNASNASGKSTIAEGLMLGLTGKTLRNLNNENVLHNTAKSGRVEVEFDDVKIIRTFDAATVKIKLFVDGVEKTVKGSNKETKKLVEEQVGMSFESLSNILIFGQHNVFAFLDATEAQKREVTENLTNIKEYNAYEEAARVAFKEHKNDLKYLEESYKIYENQHKDQSSIIEQQLKLLKELEVISRREIATIESRINDIPDIEEIKIKWEEYNNFLTKKQSILEEIQKLSDSQIEKSKLLSTVTDQKTSSLKGKESLVERLTSLQQKSPLLEERKYKLWNEVVIPQQRQLEHLKNQIKFNLDNCAEKIKSIRVSSKWDEQIASTKSKVLLAQSDLVKIEEKVDLEGQVCPTCYGKINAKNIQGVVEILKKNISNLNDEMAQLLLSKQKEAEEVAILITNLEKETNEKNLLCTAEISNLEKNIEKDVQQQKTEYLSAKQKLEQLISDCKSDILCFDEKINQEFDEKIQILKNELQELELNSHSLKSALDNITIVEKPLVTIEDIGKLQGELETLHMQKAEKEYLIDHNSHIDAIASWTNLLDKTSDTLGEIQTKIKIIEEKLPYLDFWVTHMGKEGIRGYVIDQIIPSLNEQIDYWMNLIYQGSMSLSLDKYFKPTITSAVGTSMVFGQSSGGERNRINLAIMLAFRQITKLSTNKNPNILFMDEVGENLDEEGIYSLWDTLQEIAKESTVFVITHNPTLLSLMRGFPTIKVVKKNGAMKLAA